MVCALMLLVMLGCWSSDSLFITLTATPLPTPTRPASVVEGLYRIGERVKIAGQGIASVYLTQDPEPVTRRNRVPNAACYPNTTVEITDVERVDGVTYYLVACNNVPGWLAEDNLVPAEGG